MGLDPKKMPKALRDRLGITLVGGHARPALSPCVPGYFYFDLHMDPPTTTHHAKKIAVRGGRPTLVNIAALAAVWDRYLAEIPARQTLVPLAPPVVLHVSFRFPRSADREYSERLHYHIHKPDLDNSLKVLKDVLALRGYLAADEHVSRAIIEKRWSGSRLGSIFIYARSLKGDLDFGERLLIAPAARPGIVYPTDWLVEQDRKAIESARRTPRLAAALGTPGGRRRDEQARRRGRPRSKTVRLPPTGGKRKSAGGAS